LGGPALRSVVYIYIYTWDVCVIEKHFGSDWLYRHDKRTNHSVFVFTWRVVFFVYQGHLVLPFFVSLLYIY
jgi:hypothetical protein